MREEANEAFLLGDTIFDDLITDQEGLHAWFHNVWHTAIVRESGALSKRMCFSARSQSKASVVRFLSVGSGHTRTESVVYRKRLSNCRRVAAAFGDIAK